MNNKVSSRGTQIDTDLCVSSIGNRFDLVLVAAIRSRELHRQNQNAEKSSYRNNGLTALLDVQNGKIGREYLRRIK